MTLALAGVAAEEGTVLPTSATLIDTGNSSPQRSQWAVTRKADVQPKKKWTVLVYINGANDLETYGILNMNQMEKVGSTEDMNIVTQFKRIGGRYDNSNGDWSDTRRYYVDRGTDASTVTSTLISQASGVDMGNPATLQEFVDWAWRPFPRSATTS